MKKQYYLSLHQKNKILRNKLNQRCERPVHWKLLSHLWNKLKKTEVNAKTFHAYDRKTAQLKCQYSPKQSTDSLQSHQNSNGIFHRTGPNNSKICVGQQKIPNSQSDLSRKDRAGGIMLPDLKLY